MTKEPDAPAREVYSMRSEVALDLPAASVVHDLRNVLCGILCCAEHALSSLPDGSAARSDLEQIQGVAERAASYGKNLLTNARDAARDHLRSFDLDDAVRAIEPMLRRMAGDGLPLDLHLRACGAYIWGDPGQLDQVLVNLIINARQAMPSGGRISVHTRLLKLSSVPRCVVLRVRDTGTGMDERTRSRAFEPFFSGRAEPAIGTGLGLANVHALVRSAGGRVAVRSRVGAGTRVTICWPCVAVGDDARVSPPPVSYTSLRRPRVSQTVLLVEDEALVALAAQHHLASAGYHVLVARNARQAQLLAAQHRDPLDVLITDIALPGSLNGCEVARAVKALHPGVAVVYMSAHSRAWLLRQRLIAPTALSLDKPFSGERLLEVVVQALAEARLASATTLPPQAADAGR